MKFKKERTPKMENGMERDFMSFILNLVKRIRGLTTCLDTHAGINGKWLKPEEVYNFRVNLFLRIPIFLLCVLKEEDARKEWMKIFDKAIELKKIYGPCPDCKQHNH